MLDPTLSVIDFKMKIDPLGTTLNCQGIFYNKKVREVFTTVRELFTIVRERFTTVREIITSI